MALVSLHYMILKSESMVKCQSLDNIMAMAINTLRKPNQNECPIGAVLNI